MVLAAALVLTACARADTSDMDRQADTLATAISWPRQYSAEGFARAALATPLGQSPSFAVLEVTDLEAAELTGQSAYLLIRISRGEEVRGPFDTTEAATACYGLRFNHYGVMGSPEKTGCPDGAQPITYPPSPEWADAAAFEAAFADVLARLPAAPSETRVKHALYGAWLLEAEQLVDDVTTNLDPDDPRPAVLVRGADVAVAITAGTECLRGTRIAGTVRTERPTGECVPTFG